MATILVAREKVFMSSTVEVRALTPKSHVTVRDGGVAEGHGKFVRIGPRKKSKVLNALHLHK